MKNSSSIKSKHVYVSHTLSQVSIHYDAALSYSID